MGPDCPESLSLSDDHRRISIRNSGADCESGLRSRRVGVWRVRATHRPHARGGGWIGGRLPSDTILTSGLCRTCVAKVANGDDETGVTEDTDVNGTK